jgi:hypothetical protein
VPIVVLLLIVPATAPPFRRTIFTVDPGLPVYLQVMVWVVPRFQVSPPFGEVTVIEEFVVPCGTMEKLSLLVSLMEGWLMLWTLTL